MEEEQKPKIIFDSREKKSLILENLRDRCDLEEKLLDAGDFVLSDRVCCERKTAEDFVNSLTDGRLFSQLVNLKENFSKPVLVIEGNELYNNNVKPEAVRGAIAAVVTDFAVPIIWTKTLSETADMLFIIAKREQITDRRPVKIRVEKKPKTIKEQQEFLISGLFGIDSIRAKDLLKHFKCPEFLFTASERELRQVKGIGKELARKIRQVLEQDYE